MATIDYMICAYGPYSASATGGNGWSRDCEQPDHPILVYTLTFIVLAGVLTVPATPFFSNIGDKPLEYGNTILFCIASVLVVAVYVIYWKGPVLRKRSPFAQQLHSENKGIQERRASRMSIGGPSRNNSAMPAAGDEAVRDEEKA